MVVERLLALLSIHIQLANPTCRPTNRHGGSLTLPSCHAASDRNDCRGGLGGVSRQVVIIGTVDAGQAKSAAKCSPSTGVCETLIETKGIAVSRMGAAAK
jgi:hypothetical protein